MPESLPFEAVLGESPPSAGVNLLAAVLPYLRRACSGWEDTDYEETDYGAHLPGALLRIRSAQVVLQTGLPPSRRHLRHRRRKR